MLVGGRYELCEVAGRGGMAIVWRALLRGDHGFVRTVAVKQMHPHLAKQPQYVDMFVEEARVGATLYSPNIAQAYDFVAEHGNYYLVMEWVDGIDLGSFIRYHVERETRPRWDLIAAIGIGTLRGLAAAHERTDASGALAPVVHRDVSPHNILLTTRGMVKVIDFGLSLAADRTSELTEPGVVKGKMSYLSPEIVAGERPTPLSDQFAAGSVLWEALVGRKLFEGATDYDTYVKVRDVQVQPLRPYRPDVPAPLVNVIHKALAPREEQRYASVRDMAGHLGAVLRRVKSRKDLHTLLARSVLDAREGLGMGAGTGDPTSQTPVADLRGEHTPAPDTREKKGLWHRLSIFGRRR